jgi:hypothetical protein
MGVGFETKNFRVRGKCCDKIFVRPIEISGTVPIMLEAANTDERGIFTMEIDKRTEGWEENGIP